MTVTNTITLEVGPVGHKFEVRMWTGKESLRVQYTDKHADALQWAKITKVKLVDMLGVEVVVVDKPVPAEPNGLQPDMFPVRP